MAGTLGREEFELKLFMVLVRDSVLKELRVLGKELRVSGACDSVDADVERL